MRKVVLYRVLEFSMGVLMRLSGVGGGDNGRVFI